MSIEFAGSLQLPTETFFRPEDLVPEGLVAMTTPSEALQLFRIYSIRLAQLLLSGVEDPDKQKDLDKEAESWGNQLIVTRKAYGKAS